MGAAASGPPPQTKGAAGATPVKPGLRPASVPPTESKAGGKRPPVKGEPELDLLAQLATLVEALEAAQSILRGKPLPRRTLVPRTSAGALSKSATVKATVSKKARGR
jgi:hypothetical protein